MSLYDCGRAGFQSICHTRPPPAGGAGFPSVRAIRRPPVAQGSPPFAPSAARPWPRVPLHSRRPRSRVSPNSPHPPAVNSDSLGYSARSSALATVRRWRVGALRLKLHHCGVGRPTRARVAGRRRRRPAGGAAEIAVKLGHAVASPRRLTPSPAPPRGAISSITDTTSVSWQDFASPRGSILHQWQARCRNAGICLRGSAGERLRKQEGRRRRARSRRAAGRGQASTRWRSTKSRARARSSSPRDPGTNS